MIAGLLFMFFLAGLFVTVKESKIARLNIALLILLVLVFTFFGDRYRP